MPDTTPSTISPAHAKRRFADDPEVLKVALRAGVTSVASPDDIPEALAWVPQGAPGLLFWHHPLGGGDPVPQLRPDSPVALKNPTNPKDKPPKYIFPRGSGSVVSVHPDMKNRIAADAKRDLPLVIVEGTCQYLWAVAYASEAIVVGIQGCYGFSYDGIANGELTDLARGRDVFVCFDADVSSNPKVYAAAESLDHALSSTGAASVKFMMIPGSATTGFDDFLIRQKPDTRPVVMESMIGKAQSMKKIRRPREARTQTSRNRPFDYISYDLHQIVQVEFFNPDDVDHRKAPIAGEIDGEKVVATGVLLDASVRVVAVTEVIDDLAVVSDPADTLQDLLVDLEVTTKREGVPTTLTIKNVSERTLGNVRGWLSIGGLHGASVTLGNLAMSPSGRERIGEVIRNQMSDPGVERKTRLTRTGYYKYTNEDGQTRYCYADNSGATIGFPKPKVHLVSSKIDGPGSGISLPDIHELSVDDIADAARRVLEATRAFVDPTPWICGISAIVMSISGVNPDAVLYFTGGAGSGKTSIANALASGFGASWGVDKSAMANVDGSNAYVSDLARGIHHCPIIVDDARARSTTRAQESQDDAIDALIRIGYGGGGASKGKKVLNRQGQWVAAQSSLNRPFVIITGETIPDQLSSVERCFVVPIKRETSLTKGDLVNGVPSGLEILKKLSEDGTVRTVVAAMVASRTMIVNHKLDSGEYDPLADIVSGVENTRRELAAEMKRELDERGVAISERAASVAGTFLAGAYEFSRFLRAAHVTQSKKESDEIFEEWKPYIVRAATLHTQGSLSSLDETSTAINKLHDLIASGRYTLDEPTSSQTRIGQLFRSRIDEDWTDCVALYPTVVAQALACKTATAERNLAPVLLPDKSGNKKKVVATPTGSLRCFVIPRSTWDEAGGDIDDGDDVRRTSVDEDF